MKEKIDKIIQQIFKLSFTTWKVLFAITLLYSLFCAIRNMIEPSYIDSAIYPTILHGFIIILIFLICIKNFYKRSKTDIFLNKEDSKIHIIFGRTIVSFVSFVIISILFQIPSLLAEGIDTFHTIGLETFSGNLLTLILSPFTSYIYVLGVFIIFLARFICSIFMKDFKKLLKINSLALIGSYALCYIYFGLSVITLLIGFRD